MRRWSVPLVIVFFAAGALMFLLAPRDSQGFTARTLLSSPVQEHVSGFRTQIVLGQARRIRESDQVVMRVQTPRHSLSLRYLRGAVYDSYSSVGARWFSRGGGANVSPPLTLGPELLRQLVPVRISLNRSLLPSLFVPYPTLWVDRQGDIRRGDRELNFFWQEESQEDRPLSYVAMAWAQPPSDAQRQVLDYLRRQHDQRHPAPPAELEVPPSVEAAARQWCSDLVEQRRFGGADANELDLAIAHRLAQRLGQWCSYTLDLTDIDTRLDPLEDFLLKTRRGNCEYFASALALMCNSLQVRARLASGYLMNEYNPVTGQYVVRQRDAHAWTEVYTPTGDWQVFDATPRATEPSLQTQDLSGRLEQYADAVRAFWNEKVLGYNGQLRRRLMEQVHELGLVLWHALRLRVLWVGQSALRTLLSGQTELILARLSGLLGMGAIGVFGLILWRANARARRRRALARGRCWAALLLVPELVDRLAGSAGAGDDLTLRQRALARCQVLGLDPQAVGELVGIYYSARWGGAWPDDPVIRRARNQARQIARRLGLLSRRGV
jgi:transglutaminase-like putative cysteine protease